MGTTGLQEESRWGSSYWEQICILFMRAVKTRRFESLQLQDFCQFVLVGLLCGRLSSLPDHLGSNTQSHRQA